MADRLSYIEDGDERFPNSCVKYVKLESADLRQFFARFREREDILLRQLRFNEQAYYRLRKLMAEHFGEEVTRLFEAACRLHEAQAALIWMSNGGNCREWDEATGAKPRPRQGKSSQGTQLGIFDMEDE